MQKRRVMRCLEMPKISLCSFAFFSGFLTAQNARCLQVIWRKCLVRPSLAIRLQTLNQCSYCRRPNGSPRYYRSQTSVDFSFSQPTSRSVDFSAVQKFRSRDNIFVPLRFRNTDHVTLSLHSSHGCERHFFPPVQCMS